MIIDTYYRGYRLAQNLADSTVAIFHDADYLETALGPTEAKALVDHWHIGSVR